MNETLKLGKPKGMVEKLEEASTGLQRVANRIQLYKHLEPFSYAGVAIEREDRFAEGETEQISLIPTAKELAEAPKRVREVFTDLGIESTDQVWIKLKIHPRQGHFDWTLIPDIINDNKFGITLSTREKGEYLYAHADLASEGNAPDWSLECIPLFKRSGNAKRFKLAARASEVVRAYQNIGRNTNADESYSRIDLHKLKTMKKVGRWTADLVDARRWTR